MADIIDLASRAALDEKYDELLDAMLDRVQHAGDVLLNDLVNLAMLGPWREWNEKQQVGVEARIGTKALAETSDPRIRALAQLLDHAGNVLQELRKATQE